MFFFTYLKERVVLKGKDKLIEESCSKVKVVSNTKLQQNMSPSHPSRPTKGGNCLLMKQPGYRKIVKLDRSRNPQEDLVDVPASLPDLVGKKRPLHEDKSVPTMGWHRVFLYPLQSIT